MGNPEPKPFWKFDGTVNWPILFAVIGLLFAAAGFGNKLLGQIDNLHNTFEGYQVELKDLRKSVDSIRLDLAERAATEKAVQDHEMRIRALELRPN
jgi:hypothetical protein